MLEQRAYAVQDVENILGPGRALDNPANVLRLPATFIGACRSFCPLWQVCLDEGRRQGAPSVLGKDVEEAIGALGNSQRACELMAGAVPANDLERDITLTRDRIDWVAKKFLLSDFREAEKLSWTDPWLQALDLEYFQQRKIGDCQQNQNPAMAPLGYPRVTFVDQDILTSANLKK